MQAYRQVLPQLDLSIERYTDAVPDDGAWHLIRAGQQLGRYRSLRSAQEAWRVVVEESGWKAEPRPVDATDARRREATERWARDRAG